MTVAVPDWKTFAAARPGVSFDLFAVLASTMGEAGIPFCPKCQDWHEGAAHTSKES